MPVIQAEFTAKDVRDRLKNLPDEAILKISIEYQGFGDLSVAYTLENVCYVNTKDEKALYVIIHSQDDRDEG